MQMYGEGIGMKINVRGIVCGVLVLGIGLTAVLGLLAPLVSVGTRFTGGAENGFDIFSGESPVFFTRIQEADDVIASMIGMIGTLCIVQCAVGAAVIGLGVLCILFPAVRRIGVWVSALAMGFTVAYLVFGIIYTETFLEVVESGEYDLSNVQQVLGDDLMGARTLAYIPMIFSILAFIAAAVVNCIRWKPSPAAARAPKGAPATDALQAAPAAAPVFADGSLPQVEAGVMNAAPAAGGLCEGERVELLCVLADLHKQGALTDEEFAAEKARLLRL